MAYVIQRTDQGGGYVAPSGSPSSYVRNPANARQFATVESAERDRCPENERICEYFPGSLRPLPR